MSFKEKIMKWSTPTATDMRFGFEITMYIANR
jgi:coenzyme PQQ precursor peptide PqqA